jgi:hypothetical protein
MLARGDLAISLLGVSFMGRPWPVRALSFGAAPGGNSLAKDLGVVVGESVAGDLLRNGRLPIECRRSPRPLWKHALPAPEPWEGLRVPSMGWLLADQVTRNWCWEPPGRLRWVLELIESLKQAKAEWAGPVTPFSLAPACRHCAAYVNATSRPVVVGSAAIAAGALGGGPL